MRRKSQSTEFFVFFVKKQVKIKMRNTSPAIIYPRKAQSMNIKVLPYLLIVNATNKGIDLLDTRFLLVNGFYREYYHPKWNNFL